MLAHLFGTDTVKTDVDNTGTATTQLEVAMTTTSYLGAGHQNEVPAHRLVDSPNGPFSP
jgi:hypothetical protein